MEHDILCQTEELVERIGIKDKPKVIDLTRKEAIVHTLTEARIICRSDEKVLTFISTALVG